MTNVLILAAGQIPTNKSDDVYPPCLTEFEGISILERIVKNTQNISPARHAFSILDRDARRYHLDKVINLLVSDGKIVRIPESTQGSGCTALLTACQLPCDDDLLIVSANELVDLDFAEVIQNFKRRQLDGGTLTFRSVHPRYSYVRLNEDGYVIEAAQQNPISQFATAGVFWFARTGDFVEAAKECIRKGASVAGKFFIAPCFNELILRHARIGTYSLELNKYHPLKTDRQLQQYEQERHYEPRQAE